MASSSWSASCSSYIAARLLKDGNRDEDATMSRTSQPLEARVEALEGRVTELEKLPARIDNLSLQVQHLRVEMRGEFSTVRADITQVKTEMRVLHEEVISRIALIQEGLPLPPKRRKK